ncbi:MAG: class SAM-dependent methyltransferase [Marmoricola sp.]|nr:class SAM-dependent methyltransferase [Marmoricola sp.]
MSDEIQRQALSYTTVADAYDRARPSYPPEAAQWLTGSGRSVVLELGAGTGKMTSVLLGLGHTVIASDPLPQMLGHVGRNAPEAHRVVATAEHIPLPSASVDVVVCAQSFHWFNHDQALPEIARVLRPGGVLALVWNRRDQSIPWVRKLVALIGDGDQTEGLTEPLIESEHFGWVDEKEFRNWSKHTHETLADLVRSQSAFAMLYEDRQASLLAAVDALYADYGRGHDGMLLPFRTSCFRAVVQKRDREPQREPISPALDQPKPRPAPPPQEPDTLLIDFK